MRLQRTKHSTGYHVLGNALFRIKLSTHFFAFFFEYNTVTAP